ncbi:MAG: aminopeptidase, partial [Akkermansiaceae bacterium]|nr:aminopeptidase [Akkermansiaceae bacterium]
INGLISHHRGRLAALYGRDLPAEAMRTAKAGIFQDLRRDLEELRDAWTAGLTAWLARDLNNAHLAATATYHEMIPEFDALLEECGGDLPEFYKRVRERGRALGD